MSLPLKMSLRLRLVALLLLLTGFVVVAVVLLGVRWQGDLSEIAEQQAQAALKQRSAAVAREVSQAQQQLHMLASNPLLSMDNLDASREWLIRLNSQDSGFEAFYLYALDGTVYAGRGHPIRVNDGELLDRIRAGQDVTGSPMFNRYTGQSTLLMTVPLVDESGRVAGALGGTVVLRQLVDQAFAPLDDARSRLMMFDREGRLIGSTLDDEQPLLDKPDAATAPFTAAVAAVVQAMQRPGTQATHAELVQADHPWRVLALPVGMPDWTMVYIQPAEVYSARLRNALQVMVGIAALVAALGAVVLWQMDRIILRPLARLAEAHRHLGEGDFSVRLTPEGSPELQGLSRAFNHTAEVLAQARSQAQEALQRMQLTFDASPVPMMVLQREQGWVPVSCNRSLLQQFGWAQGSPVSSWAELEPALWPSSAERGALLDDLASASGSVCFEVGLRAVDGRVLRCELSGAAIRTHGADLLVVALEDVTASREMTAHLAESERRLSTLVGSLPGMAYRSLADERWTMTFVSNGCRELIGVEPEVLMRAELYYADLVHPDDRSHLRQLVEESIATLQPTAAEYRIVRPDGAVRWVWEKWQAIVDAQGRALAMEGFIMDLTDRKASEDAQRLLQEQLVATLEQTPTVGIQWYDEEGTVLYWNAASTAMYGFSPQEVVGHSAHGTLFDDAAFEEFLGVLRGIAATGQPYGPYESEVRTRSGGALTVLATTFRIPLASGGMAFVCMDVDISRLKVAEASLRELNASLEAKVGQRTWELVEALEQLKGAQAELVRSEKMASLGSLVAGVAHELNTPIGNAVMMASTLADRNREFQRAMAEGLKRSTLQDFVKVVDEASAVLQRNLQRAADLVASFKQVAVDQSSYQRREFELSEIVQEITLAMSPLLKRAGCELAVSPMPAVRFDSFPGPLGQVFMNLIGNAMTHAYADQSGGRIALSAGLQGDRVQIEVQDFGAGISADNLSRIFDPFFTTRMGQGGTGLGLSIVYNLVTELLGGTIRVRSQPGQGTCFTLVLPRVAPAASDVGTDLPKETA